MIEKLNIHNPLQTTHFNLKKDRSLTQSIIVIYAIPCQFVWLNASDEHGAHHQKHQQPQL